MEWEWDIDKLADFLEKKCQEGVAIEHKIYEWKLAELKLKEQAEVPAKTPEPELVAKAS